MSKFIRDALIVDEKLLVTLCNRVTFLNVAYMRDIDRLGHTL